LNKYEARLSKYETKHVELIRTFYDIPDYDFDIESTLNSNDYIPDEYAEFRMTDSEKQEMRRKAKEADKIAKPILKQIKKIGKKIGKYEKKIKQIKEQTRKYGTKYETYLLLKIQRTRYEKYRDEAIGIHDRQFRNMNKEDKKSSKLYLNVKSKICDYKHNIKLIDQKLERLDKKYPEFDSMSIIRLSL
jgi:hypothetical protein